MAAVIKSIAGFSEEAVNVAINCVFSSDEDKKRVFEENLNAVVNILNTSNSQRTKTRKRRLVPSDTKIFRENVLPQIQKAIEKYEKVEETSVDEEWKLNFSFIDKFEKAELTDLTTMKSVHAVITEQEKIAKKAHLVIAYHRGLLYLNSRKFAKEGENIKEFFAREFNISYATVNRYMQFTMLIKAYPRLLVSELSFTQFSKHHNRLLKYFDEDKNLADRLRTYITISVQNKGIDIEPANVLSVPRAAIRLRVDPDYVYEEDQWYDVDSDLQEATEEETQEYWLEDDVDTLCTQFEQSM